MTLRSLARIARLRAGLFLVRAGARVAGVSKIDTPVEAVVERTAVEVIPPATMGSEGVAMLERGRVRPKRHAEVSRPLEGSALDRIQSAARNGRS